MTYLATRSAHLASACGQPACAAARATPAARQQRPARDGAWSQLASRRARTPQPARHAHACPACQAADEREGEHQHDKRHAAASADRAQSVPDAGTLAPASDAGSPAPAARAPVRPSSEDVWGLLINRSMCGCKGGLSAGIAWANEAATTYAGCDTPANTSGTAVEACFDAAQPTSTVVASTSPSGTMTLPAPSADPCERISQKATLVHETMHVRHADAMAQARGSGFFAAWRALAGDAQRLQKLQATFPAEVAAYRAQWQDGHDWAQDEVNSYRWERRFLVDALAALNRIC